MKNFCVTKVVATRELTEFVDALNSATKEAYIAREVRISRSRWLLRVESPWRDDVEFIRKVIGRL